MNKKAIAILGAIFILIVGTLGYLIFSKNSGSTAAPTPVPSPAPAPSPTPVTPDPVPTPSPDPGFNSSSTEPTSQNSNMVKLANDQVVSPILFFNGKGLSYFDNQGNLYQANISTSNGSVTLVQKRQLSIPARTGISKVLWPLKGNDFITVVQSGGGNSFSYFNTGTGLYTDLPSQVTSVDWAPTGDKIYYIWLENGKATLNYSDPDANNWKAVGDMWETDDTISVSPDGSQILYYETGATGAANAINSVSSDGKVWKSLVKTGWNFGVLWSPDSQKFLFAKKDLTTQKYQLWVYNLASAEVKNLGLFSTPDKAVWDNDSTTIYVSVPNDGSSGSGGLTVDTFFKMDTSTLEKKQYSQPSGSPSVDGSDLFLNSTGDKLFFKNNQDGGLYYLDLAQ